MKNRLMNLRAAFAAVALSIGLAGCGGGGDSAPAPTFPVQGPAPAPAPAPAPVEPAAVTSVPTPNYTEVARMSAFNRLNEIRAAAGLGLLAQNTKLDQAAQAHSDYQAVNIVMGHGETQGAIGFTGVSPYDRSFAAGYMAEHVAECIDFGASLAGSAQIDELMSTPYHRAALISFSDVEVGIGFKTFPQDSAIAALTVDIGRLSGNSQGAINTPISVWPAPGLTLVPTSMAAETPNPIPENNGATAGYSISVKVNESLRTLQATSFSLVDSNGTLIQSKLLSEKTDAFLASLASGKNFIALLPRSPLAKNSTYTATFVGTTHELGAPASDAGTPVIKTWSFTTGAL